MFYAHFVLAKKGPLAKIWLAAHWDKKLTKAHVFETNIESSIEGILQPKVKMALRTSGHLLLGIVRIYSRKAKYLLADCNEAFIKIKIAFRPGVVDLPESNREAAVAAITLPEVFHDFDTAMPDISIDMDAQLNQSRAEDITLKEDYGTLSLMTDDGFDEMGFGDPETGRDAMAMDDEFDHESLLLNSEGPSKGGPEDSIQRENNDTSVMSKVNASLDAPLRDDGFGGAVGEGLLDGETGGLFEPAGLFDDAPLGDVPLENNTSDQNTISDPNTSDQQQEKPPQPEDDSDDDMYDMGPCSMGAPSPPSSPESPGPPLNEESPSKPTDRNNLDIQEPEPVPGAPHASDITADQQSTAPPQMKDIPPLDQTSLIHNENESFALAPLDTTIVQGPERTVKTRRKRKLIVDELKNISGEEMKSQLSDTTDIVTTLDLAPPTKRLMHWKETGGVEKLFALPGYAILSKTLSQAYQRHLTTRSVDNEDFDTDGDGIDLDAELYREQFRDEVEPEAPSRKRRREMDSVLAHDLSHFDSLQRDIESSRVPYHPSDMSHPLEVSSFLPQHMFPPAHQMPDQSHQQMMPNVMGAVQHPPPAHMMPHMLQPDMHQLSQLPQMMHQSMIDQAPPLHTITPTIRNVPSPVVSEAYNQVDHSLMESVSQHLLPNNLNTIPDHIPQPPPYPDKQIPCSSAENQMPLQDNTQLPQSTMDHLPCNENDLHPCAESEMMQTSANMESQEMPGSSNDATQPGISDFDSLRETNTLAAPGLTEPVSDANVPENVNQQPATENGAALFPEETNHTENQQPQTNATVEPQKTQNNEFPVSDDDDDDYGAPGSVGPAVPDEQMADETYEQYEERLLTKRTTHMLLIIHSRLESHGQVNFADLVRNNKRKQVAQKFYTFLVLKKQQAVELEQKSSYGDLLIFKGPKYNAMCNGN